MLAELPPKHPHKFAELESGAHHIQNFVYLNWCQKQMSAESWHTIH